jgi:hypothetical protein
LDTQDFRRNQGSVSITSCGGWSWRKRRAGD